MAQTGEVVVVEGLATPGVQRPAGWGNQTVLYNAKRHAHTAQGLAVSTVWGTCCGATGLARQLPRAGVADAVGAGGGAGRRHRRPGLSGHGQAREHWRTPVGDRRTKDRLTDQQRTFNRCQAGLRALVEQTIAHLANAWALRRWRGLLYRVQDVYRAAGALICLGRWLHRVPT
jgi:hypothetical protein